MKRAVDEAVQNRVRNGADAGLQGSERRVEPPFAHLMLKEFDEMPGDGGGLRIRRLDQGDAVGFLRDDDGRDLRRVQRDEGQSGAALGRNDGNGLAIRTPRGNIDIVQPFEFERLREIDFDDDLLGEDCERRRVSDGGRRDETAILRDRRRLNDSEVDGPHLPGAEQFDRFGKVLIDEHHLAAVDGSAKGRVALEGKTPGQNAGLRQRLVDIAPEGGPGHQRNLQGLVCRPLRESQRNGLRIAGTGEPAHADDHAILDETRRFLG